MKQPQTFLHYQYPTDSKKTSAASIKIKQNSLLYNVLPQISKNSLHRHKNSLSKQKTQEIYCKQQQQSFLQKYRWLTQQMIYSQQSDQIIEQQNLKLKSSLYQMNSQIQKIMLKIVKPTNKIRIKTLNDNTATLKVRQKQCENNRSIIGLCRNQYRTLQRQKSYIKEKGRQFFENSIEKTKLKLHKFRKNNKALQYKNKTLGNSIVQTDDIILTMKNLQENVISTQKRKQHLITKNKQYQQQNRETQIKLLNIQSSYEIAQQYLSKEHKNSTNSQQHKKATKSLQNLKHNLQLLSKICQTQKTNYQKIYHRKLKQYDVILENIENIEQKTEKAYKQIQQNKQKIADLKQKLKIKRQNKKMHLLSLTDMLIKNDTQTKIVKEVDQKKYQQNYGQTQQYVEDSPFQIQSNISSIHHQQGKKQKQADVDQRQIKK